MPTNPSARRRIPILSSPTVHGLQTSVREIAKMPRSEGGRSAFLRRMLEYPMEFRAGKFIDELPLVSIPVLLSEIGETALEFPANLEDRHLWNLGALEQALMTQIVRSEKLQTIFEIGTFDGSTTRLFAAAVAPQEGHVYTLDLPPEDYHLTYPPEGYDGGTRVGERFSGTEEASRITQLLGDSLTFDFSPWEGKIDLVFVDGAHDYPHGLADSRNALRLVRPGGWIFWDDFGPRWHGLVRGIAEATEGRQVSWVEGTSFALLRA